MKRLVLIALCASCAVALPRTPCAGQEFPNPPGPPGSEEATMKTLDQVEPRVYISELPITISNSGSYYLTDNLGGVSGFNGITIAADDVQLDLCGFGLFGETGTLHGIYVDSPTEPEQDAFYNIAIRNGVVDNWGGWALNATNAHQSEFSAIKVWANGGGGLGVGESCMVLECSSGGNTNEGILTGDDATIRDCKSDENGKTGVKTGSGSRVSGCTATGNGEDGIKAGDGATVMDCKSIENAGNGILTGMGSCLRNSTSAENGQDGIAADMYCSVRDCLVGFNKADGIQVTWSCQVIGNNCGDNGNTTSNGAGIVVFDSGNRIENNNLTSNPRGIEVQGSGNWIANNTVIDSLHYGILVTNEDNVVVRNGVGSGMEGSTNFWIIDGNQSGIIQGNLGTNFSGADAWANLEIMTP